MCMVSVVFDYGRTVPPTSWTPDTWSQYQEILRKIEELDKKLGEPECHDPEKATWMKDIEDRLKALEESNT